MSEADDTIITIHEENESIDESIGHERERALRKLSGESLGGMDGIMPFELYPSSSSTVLFAAHKTRHLFGHPSIPPISVSSNPSVSSASAGKGKIRDVFTKQSTDDDEWTDEDDELGRFGGGLGQPATRSTASSTSSTSDNIRAPHQDNQPSTPTAAHTSTVLGEGRYAGVTSGVRNDAGATSAFGRWGTGGRGNSNLKTTVIEEEEEDEED